MRRYHMALVTALLVSMAIGLQDSPRSFAAPAASDPFQRTWARTDKPVLDGAVSRTWMWGDDWMPGPFTPQVWETYAESPGEQRKVQYFDKSRMEITHPDAVDDGLWYVTNGLLVVEMMTGQMQIGNEERATRAPANVNVVGDADQSRPITYALLDPLRSEPGFAVGEPLAVRAGVNEDGSLVRFLDHEKGAQGVTAAHYVSDTNHTVASVFWEFMNSSGLVYENDQYVTAPLFQNPFYATGFPITEAYWTYAPVGGTIRDVLFQCFERRCLTYAPDNPAGWQVEAGNVGQHYHRWRYGTQEVADGPSALANELAARVMTAPSEQARFEALLAIMSHLNVGVYTGDGQAILRGAERGPADFYLYEPELRMIAAATARGDTWGVVDLAMQLTMMELLPEGETFDPEVLRLAIQRAMTASAATPGDFTSLSPLIVRQLALYGAEPFDLFADTSLHAMRFNALAYFLVLADITVPMMAPDLPLPTGVSDLVARSNGVLKPAQISALCDLNGFVGDPSKSAWGWAKIFAEVANVVPKAVAKATIVLDAVHGAVLAYSVHVTELDQSLRTHYGHEGQGRELRFRVKVEMLDDLGSIALNCGWIIGASYPPKGPIPGVSVHWFFEGLSKHGEINCGNFCGKVGETGLALEATNAHGIATLVFQPRRELLPGIGPQVEDTGVLTGIALYQSAFINLLGSYAQYLTPKSGSIRWFVEGHKPRGYNVALHQHIDWDNAEGGEDHHWNLRICGDDPFAGPWEGTRQWVAYGQGEMNMTWPISVTFDPDTERGDTSFTWELAKHELTFQIVHVPYPSARMRVTENFTSLFDPNAKGSFTALAAIEEDTSCPAN